MAGKGLILVVDDNQKNRLLCRQNLEMEGFTVLEAANGALGLEIALDARPDLILLDIMMPEMDGYQMLEKLRAAPELERVSVLMLTAKSGAENVVRALELGANDYLRKPFDIEEMVARANTLVNLYQAQEEVRAHKLQMETEMVQASAIQSQMLPSPTEIELLTSPLGLYVDARTRPSSHVNGDFFDLLTQEGGLTVAMADCKGHGVWAGLMSMTVRTLLRSLPPHQGSTRESLRHIEKYLSHVLPEGEFVAMSQWFYDPRASRLTLSSAGMPPPLLVEGGSGRVSALEIEGRPPLGLSRVMGPLRTGQQEVSLASGDKLIAYSDGFCEAADPQGELFGIPLQRIIGLAGQHARLPAQDLASRLWEAWRNFSAGRQEDDCTLLVLEKL